MWIVAIVIAGLFVLLGLGRSLYKGRYTSIRDFLLTMFFLDIVFDDWGGDSDISDIDF